MAMNLLAGVLLLLIGFSLLKVVRDGLHPSVIFPSVWGGVLLAIVAGGSFGYLQVDTGGLLIILAGVICFILGSLLQVNKRIRQDKLTNYQINFKRVLIFCVLLHLIMLPISFSEISSITQGADDIYASAYRLREASVSGEERVGFLVGNYLTIGSFFVPLFLIGWMSKKIKLVTFLLVSSPWFVVNIYVSGRSGVVSLLLCCIYIYLINRKRISFSAASIFLLIFSLIIVIGNLLVSKIDAKLDESVFKVLSQSIAGFADYALQGPILLSEYIKNPVLINPSWDVLVFPCQLLEKVGMCVPPALHQEYMRFSDAGDVGNVYSVFFSMYPKYGLLGVVIFSGIYGLWFSFNHIRAKKSLINLFVAGYLFSASVTSVFSDTFGMSLYFFAKLFLIYLIAKRVFSSEKSDSSHTGEIGSKHEVSMATISN